MMKMMMMILKNQIELKEKILDYEVKKFFYYRKNV